MLLAIARSASILMPLSGSLKATTYKEIVPIDNCLFKRINLIALRRQKCLDLPKIHQ